MEVETQIDRTEFEKRFWIDPECLLNHSEIDKWINEAIDITQGYISGESTRIRQEWYPDGTYKYTQTTKQGDDPEEMHETEGGVSKDHYDLFIQTCLGHIINKLRIKLELEMAHIDLDSWSGKF